MFVELVLTLLILCVLLGIRNKIVFKNHCRRAAEIHARNCSAINNGCFEERMYDDYARIGNYTLDLLDLRKWSYRQFFPENLK